MRTRIIFSVKILSLIAILNTTLLLSSANAENKSPEAKELLRDTDFKDKSLWFRKSATIVDSAPALVGKMIELAPAKAKEDSFSYGGTRIENIPVNHKLHFKCLLQSEFDGQVLNLNTFAYNKAGKLVKQWTNEFKPPSKRWRSFCADFVAPSDTNYLTLWIINKTKHTNFFAEPSLIAGSFERAKITATSSYPENSVPRDNKVLLATFVTDVKAASGSSTGIITFPIPSLYKEQIPLTFNLHTEPADALVNYKIHKRQDGLNYVCEATIQPPRKGAKVIWQSLVFVGGSDRHKPPKATAMVPANTAPWLRSTPCVQSDDAAIRAKAEELAKNAPDLESYARKVIKFTSQNKGHGLPFKALDAKNALGCGGSCTSRANLGAALLRARGIPARTVSHLPAWCTSKMFEHWLTEYWHPGEGWVPLETTLESYQPPQNTYVTLAISSTADEDKAADPVHLRVIMPGAAYLSGNELTGNFYPAHLPDTNGVNTAVVQGVIKGSAKELLALKKAATIALTKAYSSEAKQYANQHTASITKAATNESAAELIEALAR